MNINSQCELCLCKNKKLVRSHIIPRAFYGRFAKLQMQGSTFNGGVTRKYNMGIYARFLCQGCESKFSIIDNWAVKFIKQKKIAKKIEADPNNSTTAILNLLTNKLDRQNISEFALTLLWRAAASNSVEYKIINLGKLKEEIRKTLISGQSDENLQASVAVSIHSYLGSKNPLLDEIFVPIKIMHTSKNYREQMGDFPVWQFGFPNGYIDIRLGGEAPRAGFFEFSDNETKTYSVLWSNNLSDKYNYLTIPQISKESVGVVF